MRAPERIIEWLRSYEHADRRHRLPDGLRLQYHSRSDAHSKILGGYILEDLLDACSVMREQAAQGDIAYGINHVFVWPSGKAKTIDLAIGVPMVRRPPPAGKRIRQLRSERRSQKSAGESLEYLLIACEEKAVMTEHVKSQPRIFSELSDSHAIVHEGSRATIAAGITMVNIAASFVSPLRQAPGRSVVVSRHDQPQVAQRMIEHLRRLPLRENVDIPGIDAYCTFVVDIDNQGHVGLHIGAPAPQPGDADHYDSFLDRMCRMYSEQYAALVQMPEAAGVTVEQSLLQIAAKHPGLLVQVSQLAVEQGWAGASDLRAILLTVERAANPPE